MSLLKNAARLGAPCILSAIIWAGTAKAGIISYDASTGLLPHDTGWAVTATGSSGSVAVGGGVLSVSAGIGNRRNWTLNPVPGVPGDAGLFMESTVRVVSESHTAADRGISILGTGHADGVNAAVFDLYAWTDRIFLQDVFDQTIATYHLDTTAGFRKYRLEALLGKYWVFVDDQLVLSGTAATVPYPQNIIAGGFGVGGNASGGSAEWKSVRLGSLAEIGGPTVPEPGSLLLLSSGTLGLWVLRRSRSGRNLSA